MSTVELLAPAGNWECVRAAVANGADAIYFGLDKFNARLRADNFTLADLPVLMQYLHGHGVRGYVTLNTLVFTDEIAEALNYISELEAAGVDAVIVQDVGLAVIITEWRKGGGLQMELHASTQMSLSSAEGLRFVEGFLDLDRAVLARELSARELDAIFEQGGVKTPLEVFVHGALCVAYSGQCLTSESLGQRSANRGECAQACRLPYQLVVDGRVVPLQGRKYLTSPQDLCALEYIPELVKMGVRSYKIEGRLKSPEYVAATVKEYRRALDGKPMGIRSMYDLEMVFSRGLTTGWLGGTNHPYLTHGMHGKKRGVCLGTMVNVGDGWLEVKLERTTRGLQLNPGDGFVVDEGGDKNNERGGRICEVEHVAHGGESEVVRLHFHHKACSLQFDQLAKQVRKCKVWKTDDPHLNKALTKTWADLPLPRELVGEGTRGLHLVCSGGVGMPLVLSCMGQIVHSRIDLVAATHRPLTLDLLQEQLGRLGGTEYRLDSCKCELVGDVILPMSELNRMRRELVQLLDVLPLATWADDSDCHAVPLGVLDLPVVAAAAFLNTPDLLLALCRTEEQALMAARAGVEGIYLDYRDLALYAESVLRLRESGFEGEVSVATPRIQKPGDTSAFAMLERAGADGVLVRNWGGLAHFAGMPLRRVADFSMNVANPYSARTMRDVGGCQVVTISYDLNTAQVADLLRATPPDWLELTIHQYIPMFHTEHCVFCAFLSQGSNRTNCGQPCRQHAHVALQDRMGERHTLKTDAHCRNTIFHAHAQTAAVAWQLFHDLGLRRYRVEFLDEDAATVRKTIAAYRRLFAGECSAEELIRTLRVRSQLGIATSK